MNKDPINDERYRKAGSLIRSGQPVEAIPILMDLVEGNSPNIYLYRELGFAKQFSGDYQGAIESFSLVIANWPRDRRGYTWRAGAHIRMGNDEQAIRDYTAAIESDPEYSNTYLHRGRTKMRIKDWVGAIEDFSFAINFNDDRPLGELLNRGKAKGMIGDFEGALNDLDQALELEVGDPIFAPLERARVKVRMTTWQGAIDDYSLALLGFPGLTNAYRERAEARRQIGDESGAALDDAEYARLGGKDLPAYK